MVCIALICFLSTECVTSIHVLGFNYHALGPYTPTFITFMHDFSGIEVYIHHPPSEILDPPLWCNNKNQLHSL